MLYIVSLFCVGQQAIKTPWGIILIGRVEEGQSFDLFTVRAKRHVVERTMSVLQNVYFFDALENFKTMWCFSACNLGLGRKEKNLPMNSRLVKQLLFSCSKNTLSTRALMLLTVFDSSPPGYEASIHPLKEASRERKRERFFALITCFLPSASVGRKEGSGHGRQAATKFVPSG